MQAGVRRNNTRKHMGLRRFTKRPPCITEDPDALHHEQLLQVIEIECASWPGGNVKSQD
jgi:hypothetical protein